MLSRIRLRSRCCLSVAVLLAAVGSGVNHASAADDSQTPRILKRKAKQTLTVAELNHGDTLRFELQNGQVRTFELESTSARIIERPQGGIVYSFDCQLQADGQPLLLRRYVCSQETFYEPWVVNGVRLWLSSSKSVFELVPVRYPEVHHPLDADLMLVVQDATLPICPQPPRPWFPIKQRFIDVGSCYNGDDPWLGPYLGQACHAGLDINMPKGTPLLAPIDFDDHWIFSGGHRWRGVRRWPNGDIWGLQSHHVEKLLLEEHTPIKAGTHYAEAAGKGVGSHQHSHFEFRLGPEVTNPGRLGGTEIDPWILFWQIFEDDKARQGELQARMQPLAPGETGQPMQFSATPSSAARDQQRIRHWWTFGDGGFATGKNPVHTFALPGVYPVTLVIDDGDKLAAHTQHVSITGDAIAQPALTLIAEEQVSFRPRPPAVGDVYGWPVPFVGHTLELVASPAQEAAAAESASGVVQLTNSGGGELPPAQTPTIEYLSESKNWLTISLQSNKDQQQLLVAADASQLPVGHHEAIVNVECPRAVNSPQAFRVALEVRPSLEPREVIVDDRDAGFYATPYFWVGHQFLRCPERGFGKRYLTNGGRAQPGEFVRFTPDLAAGEYEVLLHPQTPISMDSRFTVHVRHADGDRTFEFTPGDGTSRSLGRYRFAAGTGGFVEFHAAGSQGQIIADALVFRP